VLSLPSLGNISHSGADNPVIGPHRMAILEVAVHDFKQYALEVM
jgi:hypothetical protein